MSIEADIKEKALALGFDAVGITTSDPIEAAQLDYFQQWLADGRAADMGYLYRNMDKRFDPGQLLAGAKSVICVALNYRPAKAELNEHPNVGIARYAQYEDYHPFIKDRLFQLAEFIGNAGVSPAVVPPSLAATREDCGRNGTGTSARLQHNLQNGRLEAGVTCDRDGRVPRFKACVDSVPLAERALAQRAGLGFIGRNHMLIHPSLGGQILLGELITTLELAPDAPLENQSCAGCDRCLRACPTGALAPDGSFDARKCISYRTIEDWNADVSPAVVPPSLAATRKDRGRYGTKTNPHIQHNPPNVRLEAGVTCDRDARVPRYIFGCDECLLACPHEQNAPPRQNTDFRHHPEWQNLTPEQIHSMTEQEFQKTFARSAFLRLGLERLKRNYSVSTL